ncbi:hypothetical protein QJS04_geneDACA010420 [Acorus gramineus]|uniref:Large ribosomal subunit protein mL45 n=1 Tax=Acorus gramineus TaxID=55184 RepID=A0AAV9A2E3_ACOGR|nr:hypothetical protein QJS04_geneDACA010420 [Acorus gramineus]
MDFWFDDLLRLKFPRLFNIAENTTGFVMDFWWAVVGNVKKKEDTSDKAKLTQILVPAGGWGGLQLAIFSPGMIYDPYKPREPISFLRRCFTPSGWRRTKEDIIVELKNAYAIAKLRKLTGYSKKEFYEEAIKLYKEINTLIVKGDKTSLRKAVTEHMYSVLKNDMKQRESRWNSVYWELVEPVVSIRTLRARMVRAFASSIQRSEGKISLLPIEIGVDKNNLDKAFIQLTLEFLSKQKFEAYDLKGAVVSGDKAKEV